MEAVVFTQFILELAGFFDDGQCRLDEKGGVEGMASFGGKDLLGFDVE